MGVARSQKVSANGIVIYSREEPGERSWVLRSAQKLTTPKSSSHQDTRQSETRAVRKFQSGRSNRNPFVGSYPFFAGLRFTMQTGQGE